MNSQFSYAIIDAVGPFFANANLGTVVNWSKIPFTEFEQKTGLQDLADFYADMDLFLNRIKKLGYTAITLDDVAHMANFSWYPTQLQIKLSAYAQIYKTLIAKAKRLKLNVFITTDILFANSTVQNRIRLLPNKHKKLEQYFLDCCAQALKYNIDGIICRLGETDGLDVKGDFRSELYIKHPKQLHKLTNKLLELTKHTAQKIIIRTWTLGAYKIGDLIWNKQRFHQAFDNIKSDNFIISLKYGEGDFFRSLPPSELFYETNHPKIIEFQAKREYDGFGLLPYYVGFDYENILAKLKNAKLIGMSVWCQSGGWSSWKHITFLRHSSKWTELNTLTCAKLAKGVKAENILQKNTTPKEAEFIKLYNKITNDLFFSAQNGLYFRRVRIPPLVWVYWDYVVVNSVTRVLAKKIGETKTKVSKTDITQLEKLGKQANIQYLDYIIDTLTVLHLSRITLFEPKYTDKLIQKTKQYEAKYPKAYKFTISEKKASWATKFFLWICIRNQKQYRIVDKILLSKPMSLVIRSILYVQSKFIPKSLKNKAMGIQTFFK